MNDELKVLIDIANALDRISDSLEKIAEDGIIVWGGEEPKEN